MASHEHVIAPGSVHYVWDNAIPPAIEIEPGDIVHFETEEVSGGQIQPGDPAAKLVSLDSGSFYPLAGPVYVKGAEPGDALFIEILELIPKEWGWSAIFPESGLLPEDFPDPYLKYFDLSTRRSTMFEPGIEIPLQPFCGTMGVATDDPGQFRVLPPTKGAGNIDTRHLTARASLYLPVFVDGGLFSAGDCHAAQGDGEVCVTGIECGMTFSLRFTVKKRGAPRPWSYRFLTPPGPLQPSADSHGYFVASAIAPDLMTGAKDAIRDLIQWLHLEHGLRCEDAYVLCSLAADLKISQVVDAPNWCVSAYLPLRIFRAEV
jgi:acetamidase/formamidase